MKRPINYKPKYSLSIKYLKLIMTRAEFNDLIKKYVAEKIKHGGKYGKGNV